jgi:hypothetical protein
VVVFGLLAGPRLIARPANEFVAQAEAWLVDWHPFDAELARPIDAHSLLRYR